MGFLPLDMILMDMAEGQARPFEEEARRQQQAALEEILGGSGPKGRAGLRAPELAQLQAEQVGPSAYEGIQADPQSLAAQRAALADLQRMGRDNGGVETRAAANMAEMQAQQAARAQQQAALASLQGRGMGGSGQALAARLQGGSNAANMQAQAGTNAAMDARRQGLQALQAGAGLATNMRGQQMQADQSRAGAADAIARFNASNRQQTGQFNVGTQQQGFQNQARVAGMRSGAHMDAADMQREEARRRYARAQAASDTVGNALDGVTNIAGRL